MITPIYLGRYTVTVSERPPQWPMYVIWRAGKVVGHSASMPNAAQCVDIERFARAGRYADAPIKKFNYRLRGVAVTQRGRPTNAARAQAAADLLKIPDGE
jgi:hypothetical protein